MKSIAIEFHSWAGFHRQTSKHASAAIVGVFTVIVSSKSIFDAILTPK